MEGMEGQEGSSEELRPGLGALWGGKGLQGDTGAQSRKGRGGAWLGTEAQSPALAAPSFQGHRVARLSETSPTCVQAGEGAGGSSLGPGEEPAQAVTQAQSSDP